MNLPRARFALLAALLVLLSGDARAQLELDTDAIDALFAALDREDGPGCVLGVIHEGELVYARGYGMANLEHGVPLAPDSVLRIGSTSKQFTAACAVLAEQTGALSLDDDVREYLPELPEYGERITIRQLLNHTSGIRDYLGLMALAGYSDDDYYGNAEVYEMIARQRALNFEPGSRHLYSNSGYFLISVILERATGRTLAEFAEEHVFGPLGMTSTHFHDDYTRVVPRRADGYMRGADGKWRIHNTNLEMCGDGGVFTTVEDMLLWDANFYDPQVGGEELLDALHARGVLDDGTVLDYALGLVVGEHRGLRMISHGGAFVGFRAETIRFPDQRLSVVCFANLGAVDPSGLALGVADVALAGRVPEPSQPVPAAATARAVAAPAPVFVELGPEQVARFAGAYLDQVSGEVLEVRPEGPGLRLSLPARSLLLRPVSEREFRGVDSVASLRFEPASEEGFWTGLLVERGASLPFGPHLPWDAGFMAIEDYVGDYYSPELDAWWTVRASEGQLELEVQGQEPWTTTLIALDAARNPAGMAVFERDPFRTVTGFRLNAGRVLGLRFERRSR